jgi:hypothetical protein
VSTDAGNIATLGSDSLVLVPQSSLWSMRMRSFNAIGNPTFEVDQRNVNAGIANIANGIFLQDRWVIAKAGTMAVTSTTFATAGAAVVPGTNFQISSRAQRILLTTAQASLASSDLLLTRQWVEGPCWRELSTDVHSVSLLVRSSVASLNFSLDLRDSPATKSLVKLCTTSATPNTWSLIMLPGLPVWPSGNFAVTPGVVAYLLEITLAAGSNLIAPAADTWQTGSFVGAPGMSNFANSPVNSTFDISFIQHEPGAFCSTPIDCPFTQNYDDCLRYYQKTYDYGVVAGTANNLGGGFYIPVLSANSSINLPFPFKKPMAKAPTVSAYSLATGAINNLRDTGVGADRAVSSATWVGLSGFTGFAFTTANASTTQYQGHYTADTGW